MENCLSSLWYPFCFHFEFRYEKLNNIYNKAIKKNNNVWRQLLLFK